MTDEVFICVSKEYSHKIYLGLEVPFMTVFWKSYFSVLDPIFPSFHYQLSLKKITQKDKLKPRIIFFKADMVIKTVKHLYLYYSVSMTYMLIA